MHKPLLVDKNKKITVLDVLAREISWTVAGILIKSTVPSSAVLGGLPGLGVELCLLL